MAEICWQSQNTFDEQKFIEEEWQQQEESEEEGEEDGGGSDDDDDESGDLMMRFEQSDASDYDGDDGSADVEDDDDPMTGQGAEPQSKKNEFRANQKNDSYVQFYSLSH